MHHRAAAPSAATFATLREIEGRLKSIRNIEKITNTMKIVASTKLNRAQRAMTDSRVYGKTSNEVFDSAETKALEGEGKKKLVVVCSSDKGLCGGIHSGLSRFIRRKAAAEPGFDLVILGEKARAQLSRTNGKDIVLSFAGVGKDIPTFAEAQAISDQIVQLPTDYTEVEIVYNKFINASSYEPASVEAFSVEALTDSRTFPTTLCSLGPIVLERAVDLANMTQPTSRPSRLMRTSSPISGNTPWPTPSTGLWLKAMPARFLPVAMPWT